LQIIYKTPKRVYKASTRVTRHSQIIDFQLVNIKSHAIKFTLPIH